MTDEPEDQRLFHNFPETVKVFVDGNAEPEEWEPTEWHSVEGVALGDRGVPHRLPGYVPLFSNKTGYEIHMTVDGRILATSIKQ